MTDPAFCKHDPVTSWNAAAAERSGWQHRRAGSNSKSESDAASACNVGNARQCEQCQGTGGR
jgi:hypothetical protein